MSAEARSYLSVDLSQHRRSHFIREITHWNKKMTPCRVRRVRAVRAASRKGDSKPRPPSRPAANPAVGKILFRASSAIPVHKRPAFVTRPIQQSLPAIRSHRHASTRCPAEEAGTIVCPETPALHAERGDSPMLCEAHGIQFSMTARGTLRGGAGDGGGIGGIDRPKYGGNLPSA